VENVRACSGRCYVAVWYRLVARRIIRGEANDPTERERERERDEGGRQDRPRAAPLARFEKESRVTSRPRVIRDSGAPIYGYARVPVSCSRAMTATAPR